MSVPTPLYLLRTRNGGKLLASRDSANALGPLRSTRNATERYRVFLLEETGQTSPLYQDVDLTALDTFRMAVGLKDQAPTGGTFKLTVGGNSTGLTALDYNISASALQTALNANPGVTGASASVAVTKTGDRFFSITVSPANTALTFGKDETNLTPPSSVTISNPVAAASGVKAIYCIELQQQPYAIGSSFTPRDTSADAVSITTLEAGSATARARYQVAISPDPVGGAFRILWGEKQIAKVSCQANTAVAQKWTITPVGSLTNSPILYFDLPDNADTTERFWFDVDNAGGSAPATPSGGSVTEINTVITGDNKATVAAKIADALNTHGHFIATVDADGVITVTAATAGAKTASKTSSQNSGFAIAITQTGAAGQLMGEGFVMDDVTGTVGVYVTTGGLPATVPSFAAACTRQIAVSVSGGASASTVASTLATAIGTTDAVNAASSSSNLLTITDGSVGARAATTTVSSGGYFSTTIARSGQSVVATARFDASAAAIEDQMEGLWTVEKTGAFQWELTRTAVGTTTAPTKETGTIVWPKGLDGTLRFDTLALHQAFASGSGADLTGCVIEAKSLFTGDTTERVELQTAFTISADLMNGEFADAPIWRGGSSVLSKVGVITGYTGGTASDLDGLSTLSLDVDTVVVFDHATDGLRWYRLSAGTDAESSPDVIRPDDYNNPNNAKVWKLRA